MSRVYDQREDLHAAKKREEALEQAGGHERRITAASLAKKEDPVLSILKQMEKLSYRDFSRLARILDADPVLMDEAVEDGIAMLEGKDAKEGKGV